MDISTILGLVLGFGFILWSITLGGKLGWFFDPPSVAVVLGGMFSGFLVSFPLAQVLGMGKVVGKTVKGMDFNVEQIIKKIIELANIARKDGLLALEEAVSDINDDFLQRGVMLVVDGTDPELVKTIMETEIENLSERHGKSKSMFDALGSLGPAFGMIGTLIGLVIMLQNLDDPSSIGPAMATALLTTFYGSVLANLIFIPMATKLGLKSNEEVLVRSIMVEGLLSIQAGENPRIIEEKLKVFLSPTLRKKLTSTEEGK